MSVLFLRLVAAYSIEYVKCDKMIIFVCVLGKDNFEFNLTTIESSAVEAQPCASGWCGKSIESKDEGPLLVATERMCLQRPPSDNKERCADTFYGTKKRTIFMCFCKGDLCNKSHQFKLNHVLLTFIIMLSYFMV